MKKETPEATPVTLKNYRPYFVVIGLMALTSVVVALTVNPNISGEAGVKVEFPDQVDTWTGAELLFCTNKTCRKSWLITELEPEKECLKCDGLLDCMTIAERSLLPGDTTLLKKRYSNPSGRTVFASIVLSGMERASIHRPERCLTGQGNVIMKQRNVLVDFDQRDPLDVRVLELVNSRTTPDGKLISQYHSYYAYWFVGKNRETSNHYWRMYYMASDRIWHNIAHRWAYISVSGLRDKDNDDHLDEIKDFIRELYPHMSLGE